LHYWSQEVRKRAKISRFVPDLRSLLEKRPAFRARTFCHRVQTSLVSPLVSSAAYNFDFEFVEQLLEGRNWRYLSFYFLACLIKAEALV